MCHRHQPTSTPQPERSRVCRLLLGQTWCGLRGNLHNWSLKKNKLGTWPGEGQPSLSQHHGARSARLRLPRAKARASPAAPLHQGPYYGPISLCDSSFRAPGVPTDYPGRAHILALGRLPRSP